MHDYYDYHNAYRYLLKAERIASYGHLTRQKADIYATMAVLQADRKEQESNYSYQPTVLALFKTAFHQAVQIDDHFTACLSLSNLSYYALKHEHVVENHDEIYDEGVTLDQMAGLIDANPNYVSQVINEKKGCNFKAFINDYKIKEACRRLSDPDNYGTYTVEAIGQSVGFGSRTHFYAIFKKFTGMTPAAYQRLAQDKPSDSQ